MLEELQLSTARPEGGIPFDEFVNAWKRSGCPRVVPSSKLAAALMYTNIGEGSLSALRFPWPSFVVAVPPDVFGAPLDVFFTAGQKLSFFVFEKEKQVSEAHAHDLEDLAFELSRAYEYPAEARLGLSAYALIVGVSIEMDRQQNVRGVGNATYRRRASKLPHLYDYRLGRHIDVDCRPALREYVRGGGPSHTVQSLVRGHFRRLPRRQERIHVDAYWRGSELAEIPLRSHRVI